MKWLESRIFWGIVLILGGVLFLLQNLGLIEFAGIYWAVLLSLAGIFFLTVYFANRLSWWAIIPGVSFISIAIASAGGYLFPEFSDTLFSLIALAGIGVSFLIVYFLDRHRWWAIIPMGVMFSICLALGLTNFISSTATGGLFIIGLGVTFAIVAILPDKNGQMNWAWIPGCILTILGIFLTASAGKLFNYIISLAFILGGILVLYLTNQSRKLTK